MRIFEFDGAPRRVGAAIEVRLYAEDPARQFRPSAGLLTHARFAASARVETWVEDGTAITPLYDPLLAKIITAGADRDAALCAHARRFERHGDRGNRNATSTICAS